MNPNVIEALARILPKIIRWIESVLTRGQDPEAELDVLLAAADVVADEAERRKFGGGA